MTTEVMRRLPTSFDMCGQVVARPLETTSEQISAGFAKRLVAYAVKRLNDSGFVVDGWEVAVFTMDGDEPPAMRHYTVEFKNVKGGALSVVGIRTEHGWPSLDYGLDVAARGWTA